MLGSALRKDPRTERARLELTCGHGAGGGAIRTGTPGLRKGDLPWDLDPEPLVDTLLPSPCSPTMNIQKALMGILGVTRVSVTTASLDSQGKELLSAHVSSSSRETHPLRLWSQPSLLTQDEASVKAELLCRR